MVRSQEKTSAKPPYSWLLVKGSEK